MKTILFAISVLFSFNALALNCHGTEPFWSAEITDTQVKLDEFGDKSVLPITSKTGAAGFMSDFLQVFSSMNGPVAIVTSNKCNDSMSDFEFPHEVILFTGSTTLYGCCGEGVSTL